MLRVIGFNAGLIVVALLAAEAVFGTWLFGPSFGSLNLPHNVERRFAIGDMNRLEWNVIYTRDRFGLRGRYDNPASIGILALGGSTTNELYVTDGETWTDRLAQKFAAAGIPLSVVNAGAEGQSTVGHLRNFDAWFPLIPGLKPRYVLAYIGVNDMALGLDGAESTQDKFDRMRSPEWDRRLRHAIRNNSVFYRLWRTWRGVGKARSAQVVHARIDRAGSRWVEADVPFADPAPGSDLARRLAGYRTRIEALIARIRAHDARAIIVTQQKSHWRRENGKLLFAADENGKPNTAGYAETMLFNRAALAACR
ncbi:MAG: GDSL-type esterase/lipase family protein, partial [Pseudomonadota bacterium]